MVAIDAEVIAVVDFDLRTPGTGAHHTRADCGHGVHLVTDAAVRLKAPLLHQPIGTANIRIEKKDGLVPIGRVHDGIAGGKQFVEGNAR